jgi:hypothetical protein
MEMKIGICRDRQGQFAVRGLVDWKTALQANRKPSAHQTFNTFRDACAFFYDELSQATCESQATA